MPLYDIQCRTCAHTFEAFVWYHTQAKKVPCRQCGARTTVVWRSAPHMRPDTIPGGKVIENLTPTPVRYDSHSAIKRAMEAAGVESKVQHIGTPGSDKSPHTSRWV